MASGGKYCHILRAGASASPAPVDMSNFVVHRHKTGRSHFDLRLVQDNRLRSWSLLREPPRRKGEHRLAIERESFSPDALRSTRFEEEAFGEGRVSVWDEGEVEILAASARRLDLLFKGSHLSGRYELRRMRWYPGNRWLLKKSGSSQEIPQSRGAKVC